MSEIIIKSLIYVLYVSEFIFDLYFMGCVFKARKGKQYHFLAAAFMILLRIVIEQLSLVGNSNALIVINIFYIGFHIVLFSGNLAKRVGVTILLFALELVGELTAVAISSGMGLDYTGADQFYASIMAYMFYNTLMMFGVWIVFIKKKWTRRISLFLLFPVYQFFVLGLYLLMKDIPLINRVVVGALATGFNIWMVITVINVFQGMMERIETEEHLEMLSKQMQYELQYYKNIEHRIEEMRDIRHDFLNQVQASLLLVQAGEHDKTVVSQQRFEGIVEDAKTVLNGYQEGKWCANPVADAIIFLKSEEALKRGISFTAECVLGRETFMDSMDLCCVLGNLLDNAIEANGNAADSKRFVELRVTEAEGSIGITCRNYTEAEPKVKNGSWVTRKKDKKNHGRGLRTVEKICSKYNGKLEKKYLDHVVEMTMEIYGAEKSEH